MTAQKSKPWQKQVYLKEIQTINGDPTIGYKAMSRCFDIISHVRELIRSQPEKQSCIGYIHDIHRLRDPLDIRRLHVPWQRGRHGEESQFSVYWKGELVFAFGVNEYDWVVGTAAKIHIYAKTWDGVHFPEELDWLKAIPHYSHATWSAPLGAVSSIT